MNIEIYSVEPIQSAKQQWDGNFAAMVIFLGNLCPLQVEDDGRLSICLADGTMIEAAPDDWVVYQA